MQMYVLEVRGRREFGLHFFKPPSPRDPNCEPGIIQLHVMYE